MEKDYTVTQEPSGDTVDQQGVAATNKSFWARLWPAFACGAGLFSDGYLNSVIGSVNPMLKAIYGTQYSGSPAQKNVTSIAFVGQVVGQLFFGFTSDAFSRKWSLMASTVLLVLFAILCTAAYGVNGGAQSFFAALTAYRFFLGVGIGGEYPAGSVACAESTGELKSGTRNKWFILFTNVAIDIGFIVGALVPMIVVLCTTQYHLEPAWRISLGIGIIFPLSLFFLRLKLKEPEAFNKHSMARCKTPYWLSLKFYGPRLIVVSLIWFIYDFSSYGFGTFSSTLVANLQNGTVPLWQSFGWNTLINFFYLPGALAGAWISDRIGPKMTLVYFVTAQAVVGFIMAGVSGYLFQPQYVAAFAVVYGIFLSLGEVGPGDNIGLLAAKTCATGVRGRYYGIAAAVGKIGAYCGTYALGTFVEEYDSTDPRSVQYPFYVAGSLCILSAALALFFLPNVTQDTIDEEDVKFRTYLQEHGFDVSQLGLGQSHSSEGLVEKNAAAG